MGLHGFNLFSLCAAVMNVPENEAALPVPQYTFDEIQELFQCNELLPGKTVILAPYAKTLKRIPASFWSTLAQKLKDKGLCVGTNVVGKEQPVSGTHPVSMAYRLAIPFLGAAGAAIGLRSGFQDVTCTARCLKISLTYKDEPTPFRCCSVHEAFDLSEMYHQPDQYDLLYSQETEDGLIHEIVELVANYFKNMEN